MRAAGIGWPTVELGRIAEFRNGINYNKSNFGAGIPVISVKDFWERSFPQYDGLEEINPDGVVRPEHLLRNGDILFVRSNGNRELIGRSLFIRNLPPRPVTHSAFTIRVRLTSGAADARFFAYLFRSPVVRQVLSAQGNGANISNLNQDILTRLKVSMPPLHVQERIASILSAYDDLIENNTRRITILEEMARRIYEEWFVRFRFPGHEGVRMVESELGLVPKGWQCGAFTEIADVLSGGTPKKAEPEFWGGSIPFFTPSDAPKTAYVLDTETHITGAGLARCASQLYPKDTVFITARGTVGKLALAASDMAMNQSCYALKCRSGYGQLFLYLATQGVVSELKAKSHGAVFDTIIMDTFRLMRIVKPPVELASRLESFVRPLFGLSLTLSRKNANLRATRDLLLPKLISGEIDVSAAPEPESLAA